MTNKILATVVILAAFGGALPALAQTSDKPMQSDKMDNKDGTAKQGSMSKGNEKSTANGTSTLAGPAGKMANPTNK